MTPNSGSISQLHSQRKIALVRSLLDLARPKDVSKTMHQIQLLLRNLSVINLVNFSRTWKHWNENKVWVWQHHYWTSGYTTRYPQSIILWREELENGPDTVSQTVFQYSYQNTNWFDYFLVYLCGSLHRIYIHQILLTNNIMRKAFLHRFWNCLRRTC